MEISQLSASYLWAGIVCCKSLLFYAARQIFETPRGAHTTKKFYSSVENFSTYFFQPRFKGSVVPAIISDLWRSIIYSISFLLSHWLHLYFNGEWKRGKDISWWLRNRGKYYFFSSLKSNLIPLFSKAATLGAVCCQSRNYFVKWSSITFLCLFSVKPKKLV